MRWPVRIGARWEPVNSVDDQIDIAEAGTERGKTVGRNATGRPVDDRRELGERDAPASEMARRTPPAYHRLDRFGGKGAVIGGFQGEELARGGRSSLSLEPTAPRRRLRTIAQGGRSVSRWNFGIFNLVIGKRLGSEPEGLSRGSRSDQVWTSAPEGHQG